MSGLNLTCAYCGGGMWITSVWDKCLHCGKLGALHGPLAASLGDLSCERPRRKLKHRLLSGE